MFRSLINFILLKVFILVLLLHVSEFYLFKTLKENSENTDHAADISSMLQFLFNVKDKLESKRLPNTSFPSSYEIELTTNIHKGEKTFSGFINIFLEVREDIKEITLNAGNLEIIKVNLENSKSGENSVITNFKHEKRYSVLIIETEEILSSKSLWKLSISYEGKHLTLPKGFYATQYKDLNDELKWIGATQFEFTEARHAFPCYDEPAFKATFKISIVHNENYVAHSNMPVLKEPQKIGNEMVVTKFQESIPMSTYLVAFTVTDFVAISTVADNVTHEVLIPRLNTNESLGQHALTSSITLLKEFEDYFDIKYPLSKITHIGIPEHDCGGMENYGLITYPVKGILALPNLSKLEESDKYYTIAHETAHQWIGNLVTTKWWDTIWLNEATAVHYGLKIVNYTRANFYDFYFIFHMEKSTFESVETFPISYYIETDQDIDFKADKIVYHKGAYIFHMFENTLTEKVMKKAMRNYLKDYRFSSVGEEDLFNEIQSVATESKIPFYTEPGSVKKAFSTWLHEKGYPILYVNRSYETGRFTVVQKPYVIKNYNSNITGRAWHIPITYTTETVKDFDDMTIEFILDTDSPIEIYPNSKDNKQFAISPEEWLILNKQKMVPMRILYDEKNWKLIIKSLHKDPGSIHPMNRVQLIRDLSFFFSRHEIDRSMFMEFLLYLKGENNPEPWHRAITEIANWLMREGLSESKKEFVRELIDGIFKKIMKQPDKDEHLLWEIVRANLYEIAIVADYEGCERIQNECQGFQANRNDSEEIKILKAMLISNFYKTFTYPCIF